MDKYLFEEFETLKSKAEPKPEQLKNLIYRFNCHINEKISAAEDLTRSANQRTQAAREAAEFRNQLIEKLEKMTHEQPRED